jgi:hypothetical protein
MRSQFDQALRDGTDVIAQVVYPRQVEAVRARGDQRRRHQAIASAITVVAVVAAGGAGMAQLASADRASTPAPAISRHSHHSHHSVRPAAHTQIVPNVVGLTVPAAESLLAAAGFMVTAQMSACSSASQPAGTVCHTDPVAGQRLPVGAKIVVYVAAQQSPTP